MAYGEIYRLKIKPEIKERKEVDTIDYKYN